MISLHDYLLGLLDTALAIGSNCGALVLAYRIVRFAHLHRAGQ